MQRSLYSGVSGMRNHQTKMDVIGNNIANVNTTAFKGGTVLFQDILSQTLRGATGPQDNRGGVNPLQVGLGMNIASITNNHTQGSLKSTGRITDMAIQGSGFFMVNDGQTDYFTRDGAFALSPDGYLVQSGTGYRLQGWTTDAQGLIDTAQPLGPLNIPIGSERIANPTTYLQFSGNLHAGWDAAEPVTMTTVVYDSLGIAHEVEIVFEKTGNDNEWTWSADYDGSSVGSGTINFTDRGSFEDVGEIQQIIIAPGTGAADISFDLNFSKVTQVVGPMELLPRYQDGYPSGILESFTIGKTGLISGIYSNGLIRELGVVALAGFTNPEGLSKMANNLWLPSANSGGALVGAPGKQGLGTVEGGVLEMSNVDLVNEFTEMITTSRAFQANSRVITTSDEMLAEVVNIKR